MGHLQDGEDALVLIGADRGFWRVFQSSAEHADQRLDPIDRWSKRIITAIATAQGGHAVFPSDGPPYAPFIAWAMASGRFWQSPTGMLVHDAAGLMISIRGAIRVPNQSVSPAPVASSPCDKCKGHPCETACPVSALAITHFYDVPKCKSHLSSPKGAECMTGGCLVRQICPISRTFARDPAQSAFHMRAFMGQNKSGHP